MNLKTYKTIFRLDYQPSYKMADQFGKYADYISNKLENSKTYLNPDIGLNVVNTELKYSALTIEKCNFVQLLALDTFSISIEHLSGYEVEKISRHEAIKLADSLFVKIREDGVPNNFERIGFRTKILYEGSNLSFQNILDFFSKNNSIVFSAITNSYNTPQDVGVTIESKKGNNDNIRVVFGPYQENEAKKHFTFEGSPIKEGLIFDVDSYQFDNSFPNISIEKQILLHQNTVQKVCAEIVNNILNQLK